MGNSKVFIGLGVVAFVIAGIIALVAISLKKLQSDEVGLKYDTFNKKLGEDPTYEGLHMGPPAFEFIKFPSVFKTFQFTDLTCLNRDGVTIRLSVSYQYRVNPTDLHRVVLLFKDHASYEQVLNSVGASALHESCSQFNTSQFQSERGTFMEDLRKRLVDKYTVINSEITDLQVNDIRRPTVYESSLKRKEVAREDIVVAENERPRKLTEANTAKFEAETQARIIVDKADSDARVLMNKAIAEAAGITEQYRTEAGTYKQLIGADGLGLNNEDFIKYMGVRAIQDLDGEMFINMAAPAKTSYP